MQEYSSSSSSSSSAAPRLSAIPFSSSKLRGGGGGGREGREAAAVSNSNIEWTDLTKEPLVEQPVTGHPRDAVAHDMDNSRPPSMSMPEDHLEDLLALPLGQNLKSRRSKVSLASAATSNASVAFPPSTTHNKNEQLPNPVAVDRPVRKDSLRKRAQSTPMKATSSSQSASSSASASLVNNNKKKQRRLGSTDPASPSASPRLGSSSNPNSSTPRPRAVTNNALTPKKSTGPSPTPVTSASRRAPHKQGSTPTNRKQSSITPSRSHSQSSPRNTDSAFYAQFDADSVPPWIEQKHSIPLYRSDLAAEPGSLADLARHAQNKMNGVAMEDVGNTSARSHDDQILPAVAKQIRAQQLLEAQQREAQGGQRGAMKVADASRVEREQGHSTGVQAHQADQIEKQPFTAMLPPDLQGPPAHSDQQQPASPSMYLQPDGSASFRQRTASRPSAAQSGSQLSLSTSAASQSQSQRTHHTGRQELWQSSPLNSPTVAKENGFAQQQQQQQSFAAAMGQNSLRPATATAKNKQAVVAVIDEKQKGKVQEDGDKHSKGCRCIIM